MAQSFAPVTTSPSNHHYLTRMDFVKDLLLGGTAGIIAKTSCAPLERVKIVLQTQSANTQIASGSQYKGIGDTFKRILAEQGVLSFWYVCHP